MYKDRWAAPVREDLQQRLISVMWAQGPLWSSNLALSAVPSFLKDTLNDCCGSSFKQPSDSQESSSLTTYSP